MTTWKIIVKTTQNVNLGGVGTVHLEKGMSVDYVSSNSFGDHWTQRILVRRSTNFLYENTTLT